MSFCNSLYKMHFFKSFTRNPGSSSLCSKCCPCSKCTGNFCFAKLTSPSGVSDGHNIPHWDGCSDRGPLTLRVFSNCWWWTELDKLMMKTWNKTLEERRWKLYSGERKGDEEIPWGASKWLERVHFPMVHNILIYNRKLSLSMKQYSSCYIYMSVSLTDKKHVQVFLI